jgi:hypothetical protein
MNKQTLFAHLHIVECLYFWPCWHLVLYEIVQFSVEPQNTIHKGKHAVPVDRFVSVIRSWVKNPLIKIYPCSSKHALISSALAPGESVTTCTFLDRSRNSRLKAEPAMQLWTKASNIFLGEDKGLSGRL